MIYEPEWLDRLERLGNHEWEGVVYRHMFGSYPPSRRNTAGARWNPRGVAAIYSSLERNTALVEAAHRIALEPFRPRARRTHRIDVRLRRLVDLADRSVLAQLGVTDVELADDDFAACQRLGGAVAWLGNDDSWCPLRGRLAQTS